MIFCYLENTFFRIACFYLLLSVILLSLSLSVFSASTHSRSSFFDDHIDSALIRSPKGYVYNGQYVDLQVYNCTSARMPSDIGVVSLLSNPKQLNATLWLNSEINSSSKDIFRFSAIVSTSAIDNKYDYEYSNILDFSKKIQVQELTEFSPMETFPQENVKYLSPFGNISNYINRSAVNLPLDLSKINMPERYIVYFKAESYILNNSSKYCGFEDVTLPIPIPRAEFDISALPESVVLRKGEAKDIQIGINSSLPVDSDISLESRVSAPVATNFSANEINLIPYGLSTSLLHMKAFENATVGTYILPIQTSWEWNLTDPIDGSKKPFVEEGSKDIIITVEDYPIQQQIDDLTKGLYGLWKDNAGVIILVIGIFLTPFGAYVFDKMVKKGKKKT